MMSVSNGEKTQLARVERKVDQWSSNLHQWFACNGNEEGSSRDDGDAGRAREASVINPYLADPLHFGEEEVKVSPVVLPAKLSNEVALRNFVPENCVVGNHVSMLETFAPAIEAMKSGLFDSNSEQEKVLYDQMSFVHFRIGTRKKSLGTAPDLNSPKKDLEKIMSWFGNDNEKDNKKRRAEKILKESIESSQELAQF